MPPDKIDEAINGAAQPQVQMAVFDVKISVSGRPARVIVPMELNESELRELIGWMTTSMWGQLQAKQGPKLLVPNLMLPRN